VPATQIQEQDSWCCALPQNLSRRSICQLPGLLRQLFDPPGGVELGSNAADSLESFLKAQARVEGNDEWHDYL